MMSRFPARDHAEAVENIEILAHLGKALPCPPIIGGQRMTAEDAHQHFRGFITTHRAVLEFSERIAEYAQVYLEAAERKLASYGWPEEEAANRNGANS